MVRPKWSRTEPDETPCFTVYRPITCSKLLHVSVSVQKRALIGPLQGGSLRCYRHCDLAARAVPVIAQREAHRIL